ncbi:hypothetical protein K435DRAFT_793186 [Dendrothele bispora CBS 962.96]|uniref:Uncharacterized protein n=1 Tax=Dendrothele bispora (strain CBS 962.96) TaxID=1314807 RepID=A0A4S8MGH2_DENBC|nr:hypothetical protein K435DRAFT_793186 [Dendrothele bispora CBS 962.96]
MATFGGYPYPYPFLQWQMGDGLPMDLISKLSGGLEDCTWVLSMGMGVRRRGGLVPGNEEMQEEMTPGGPTANASARKSCSSNSGVANLVYKPLEEMEVTYGDIGGARGGDPETGDGFGGIGDGFGGIGGGFGGIGGGFGGIGGAGGNIGGIGDIKGRGGGIGGAGDDFDGL